MDTISLNQPKISSFFVHQEKIDQIAILLDDERTKGIKQDGKAFEYKGRKYGGMLAVLHRKFNPNLHKVIRKKGFSGIINGTRIHRQIYHTIMCKDKCDCKVKTNPKKLNELTKQAFDYMEFLHITPIASEIPILCKEGNFCTRLDVIGYRWKGTPQQESTIISIKTGYEIGFGRDVDERMEKPFKELSATEQNNNQLQGFSERMILENEYNLKFNSYFIFYLSKYKSKIEEAINWNKKKEEFLQCIKS